MTKAQREHIAYAKRLLAETSDDLLQGFTGTISANDAEFLQEYGKLFAQVALDIQAVVDRHAKGVTH